LQMQSGGKLRGSGLGSGSRRGLDISMEEREGLGSPPFSDDEDQSMPSNQECFDEW
jgi:hypothetical protein